MHSLSVHAYHVCLSLCLSVCRSGRLSALVVSCRTVKPQSRSSRKGVYAHIYIYDVYMYVYIYIYYICLYIYISVQKLDFRRCGDKALLLHVKIIYNQKKGRNHPSHPIPFHQRKKNAKVLVFFVPGRFLQLDMG